MERRTFLKYGLFGAGVLALGSVGLHAWPTDERYRPRRQLKAIGRIEFPVLCMAATRIVQAPDADPVSIAHAVDDIVFTSLPENWRELNKFLQLLESALAGLLLDGRPRPFSRLSPEGKDSALRAFRDSRMVVRRTGYASLCKLVAAGYYGSEANWSRSGYPGPPPFLHAPPPAANSVLDEGAQ